MSAVTGRTVPRFTHWIRWIFSESLAERVRKAHQDVPFEVEERKMFGCLAFMDRGYMTVRVIEGALMAKLGPEAAETALTRARVRPMDLTGRPMKGFVFIHDEGLRGRKLQSWFDLAADFMQTQPRRG